MNKSTLEFTQRIFGAFISFISISIFYYNSENGFTPLKGVFVYYEKLPFLSFVLNYWIAVIIFNICIFLYQKRSDLYNSFKIKE